MAEDLDSSRREEAANFRFPENREVDESRAINIYELSPDEKEELKTRIQQSDGLVVVAIHPYFDDNYAASSRDPLFNDVNEKKKVQNQRIQNVLKRVLAKPEFPPVLVFEDWDYLSSTAEKLSGDDATKDKSKFYMVPTSDSDSVPVPDKALSEEINLNHGYVDPKNQEVLWNEIMNLLEDLGVKNIIIGGTNLTINAGRDNRNVKGEKFDQAYWSKRKNQPRPNTYDPGYHLASCVGNAANWLSRKFQVELSTFAAPLNRGDVKAVEAGRIEGRLKYKKRSLDEFIDELI